MSSEPWMVVGIGCSSRYAHARLRSRVVAVAAAGDAAHDPGRNRGRRTAAADRAVREARDQLGVVVEVLDVLVLDRGLADRLHADRHLLHVLGALLRGHGDRLQRLLLRRFRTPSGVGGRRWARGVLRPGHREPEVDAHRQRQSRQRRWRTSLPRIPLDVPHFPPRRGSIRSPVDAALADRHRAPARAPASAVRFAS